MTLARWFSRPGTRPDRRLLGVDFAVRSGEVLGFAGLVGARRTDVGLALFGIAPSDEGQVLLDGSPATIVSPRQALRLGIAYTTEDRRALGSILRMSIRSNPNFAGAPPLREPPRVHPRRRGGCRGEGVRASDSTSGPRRSTPRLERSGGNQQKVVLSGWLNTSPRVLILDEPTRGIDVGAKADVHRLIDDLARSGMAVILISSDLPEVLHMSDRILVMREGRQMAILDHDAATAETVSDGGHGRGGRERGMTSVPTTSLNRVRPEHCARRRCFSSSSC